MLQPMIRVPIHPCSSFLGSSVLPQSARHCPGNPGAATAGRRPQAEASATVFESVGPVVLDDVAPRLVSMDRRPDRGKTRDGGRLAPGGISTPMEMAVTRARASLRSDGVSGPL